MPRLVSRTHSKTDYPRRVAVLGAGIQGVLTALALTRAGWQVDLIDRASAPLLGASLRGEGKIHLGYVYGNEPARTTAGLMVEGALRFADLIDSWLPQPIDWKAITSEPFIYAILADTMVSPDGLSEHYEWVDDAIAERFSQSGSYLGMRTFSRNRKLSSHQHSGLSGDVVAAHLTSEMAVDPILLRAALIEAMQTLNISFHANHTINQVQRTSSGFTVAAVTPDGQDTTWDADAVVNCLWDGRLAIDATMGIHTQRSCLYRLKYVVNALVFPRPEHRPNTTFALGPYGDVVWRSDGRVYLSWYPACLGGMSNGLQPPESWHTGLNDPEIMASKMDVAAATVAALSQRIETLRDAQIESVTGGIVVAWGSSDIDQPNSELHHRHAIGVHDHDGYLSVDTGKLTTAPLFAANVVERLGAWQPGSR